MYSVAVRFGKCDDVHPGAVAPGFRLDTINVAIKHVQQIERRETGY